MPKLADQIRSFLEIHYIAPARTHGTTRLKLRAGDVHMAMKLNSRVPAVCSAMESESFLRKNRLQLIERQGPRQGANVYFTYGLAAKDGTINEKVVDNADAWEPQTEWFWEGNVQNKIVEFLKTSGYVLLKIADTGVKEQGPDILAEKDGRRIVVSVKGYPSQLYVSNSGGKKGQPKRTGPSTQARHWFQQAVFDSLLTKSEAPDTEVAVGLPDMSTYTRLLDRISWAREKLGIGCYLVGKEGQVSVLSPGHRVSVKKAQ